MVTRIGGHGRDGKNVDERGDHGNGQKHGDSQGIHQNADLQPCATATIFTVVQALDQYRIHRVQAAGNFGQHGVCHRQPAPGDRLGIAGLIELRPGHPDNQRGQRQAQGRHNRADGDIGTGAPQPWTQEQKDERTGQWQQRGQGQQVGCRIHGGDYKSVQAGCNEAERGLSRGNGASGYRGICLLRYSHTPLPRYNYSSLRLEWIP